jgi:hypothetical protein
LYSHELQGLKFVKSGEASINVLIYKAKDETWSKFKPLQDCSLDPKVTGSNPVPAAGTEGP